MVMSQLTSTLVALKARSTTAVTTTRRSCSGCAAPTAALAARRAGGVWPAVRMLALARGAARRQLRGRFRALEAHALAHHVERAALHLGVDAADVETHDAGHQHVDAAEQRHDDDDGGPAGDHAAAENAEPNGVSAVDHGEGGHGKAEPDREPKRRVGKAEHAVHRQPEHLPERILGFSRGARRAMEADLGLAEAEPSEHAAHEAIALGHGLERFEHAAVDQTEVEIG